MASWVAEKRDIYFHLKNFVKIAYGSVLGTGLRTWTRDLPITDGLVYLVHATIIFFGNHFYWDQKMDPISRKSIKIRRFLLIEC